MRTLIVLSLALFAGIAAADDTPAFQIVARDGKLSPERLEVPAGKRFKLNLRNDSRAPVEFENLDLRVEKVLAPGASSFVVIRSLAPGSYKFVDEFHADTAQVTLIAK
jgi:hypothetical protein